MSKGYQKRASEVSNFIEFNISIFAMFKTVLLLETYIDEYSKKTPRGTYKKVQVRL